MLFVGLVARPADDLRAASGFDFFQIAQNCSANAVLGEQRILPAGVHESLLPPQTKAQTIPVTDFPAHMLDEHEEMAQVVGVLNGGAQVLLQHRAEGGLPPGLAQPFDVADGLGGLALHDDRQPMLPAQSV